MKERYNIPTHELGEVYRTIAHVYGLLGNAKVFGTSEGARGELRNALSCAQKAKGQLDSIETDYVIPPSLGISQERQRLADLITFIEKRIARTTSLDETIEDELGPIVNTAQKKVHEAIGEMFHTLRAQMGYILEAQIKKGREQ